MKGGSHVSRLLAAWHKRETHQQDATVRRSSGFTIVEVMIVLGVTGALFLSAAIIISGRTARTQFEQSINEITARIRVTINEVSTGFYPNMGNFSCTRNGATLQISSEAAGPAQGTNADCVFLGKVMQFKVGNNTDPQQYNTYAVAGLRTDAAGNEVTSLAAASPHVIAPTTTLPSTPDNTTTHTLQYGLEAITMRYTNGGPAVDISAVGFINSQAQYTGSQIVSGSSQVSLIPIAGSAPLGLSATDGAQAVDTNLATSPVNPSGGVSICFKSGGTKQSGLVQIGGSGGRQLSVTLKIFGNEACTP